MLAVLAAVNGGMTVNSKHACLREAGAVDQLRTSAKTALLRYWRAGMKGPT